ncbi:MAG: TetR/AcrR family transcriptional regulator [Candidatus Sericytochromatia bacterium]
MPRNKEFDKDEIVDKAINLFWEKGYNTCSMQDIVDGLGLSRSSIYDTFKDKKNLFLLALKAYTDKNISLTTNMIENSENIKETIREIFKLILDSEHNKGCFIVNSTVEFSKEDPEILEILSNNKKEVEKLFEMAIKKGQDLKQISNKNTPNSLAMYLYTSFSGLQVISKNNTKKEDLEVIIDIILSNL